MADEQSEPELSHTPGSDAFESGMSTPKGNHEEQPDAASTPGKVVTSML